MRYIQTNKTTLELEQDPVIEFNRPIDVSPGDQVYLISKNGHQVWAQVDDVDDFTVYFISRT